MTHMLKVHKFPEGKTEFKDIISHETFYKM